LVIVILARTALLTLTLVALLCSAAIAGTSGNYVLRHPEREHCRRHYSARRVVIVRRVHGKRVRLRETVCARRRTLLGKPPGHAAPSSVAPLSAPAKEERLYAHLDPTLRQSPANPLEVIYTYSAAADEANAGIVTPMAQVPAGVLSLYSDGLLICTLSVGGSLSEGTCPVTYSAYGNHSVTVDYSAGAASSTTGQVSVDVPPPSVTLTLGRGIQSATNPLAVKYPVSAAAAGPLPSGTLEVAASDGSGCSIPLGLSVTSGECTVVYESVGTHEITLTYSAHHIDLAAMSGSDFIEGFSTTTTQKAVVEGPVHPHSDEAACELTKTESGEDVERVTECEYFIAPSTVDQNGNAVPDRRSIEMRGVATDGAEFDLSLEVPDNQPGCHVHISTQSASSTDESLNELDAHRGHSDVESSDCAGELHTHKSCEGECDHQLHGNDVPEWIVISTYAGAPGRTGSKSESLVVAADSGIEGP
jgi:hypothetical protein